MKTHIQRGEQPGVVFLSEVARVNALISRIKQLIKAAAPELDAIGYENAGSSSLLPESDTDSGCELTVHREEEVAKKLLGVLGNLWEAINELTRLRPRKRSHYRVTIFGSARIGADTEYYAMVKQLAARLADMGCMIISGGGPGVMQAANEGAASVGPLSVGLTVQLPREEKANDYVVELYHHKTFFTRLHQFIFMSDAYVVMKGGIGTLLEAAMVWQLLQVRRLYHTPLIMVGDMWKALLEWADTWLKGQQMISEEDIKIPTCVTEENWIDAVIKIIEEDLSKWKEDCACQITSQQELAG
ncbi:LOG family protein [bacterium]|nr:LOG family protein [bacterium]